jgi:hypothetical protein
MAGTLLFATLMPSNGTLHAIKLQSIRRDGNDPRNDFFCDARRVARKARRATKRAFVRALSWGKA